MKQITVKQYAKICPSCRFSAGTCGFPTSFSSTRLVRHGERLQAEPLLLKFADRVDQKTEQIFVAHGGGLRPSLERVVVVHEAHDVQGDAPDGGEALRSVQRSVPHSILAHDDVRNPTEAILDPPVVAREFQQPLRRNLRAHDAGADGLLRPALQLANDLDPADGLEAGPIMSPAAGPSPTTTPRRGVTFSRR